MEEMVSAEDFALIDARLADLIEVCKPVPPLEVIFLTIRGLINTPRPEEINQIAAIKNLCVDISRRLVATREQENQRRVI